MDVRTDEFFVVRRLGLESCLVSFGGGERLVMEEVWVVVW